MINEYKQCTPKMHTHTYTQVGFIGFIATVFFELAAAYLKKGVLNCFCRWGDRAKRKRKEMHITSKLLLVARL